MLALKTLFDVDCTLETLLGITVDGESFRLAVRDHTIGRLIITGDHRTVQEFSRMFCAPA